MVGEYCIRRCDIALLQILGMSLDRAHVALDSYEKVICQTEVIYVGVYCHHLSIQFLDKNTGIGVPF